MRYRINELSKKKFWLLFLAICLATLGLFTLFGCSGEGSKSSVESNPQILGSGVAWYDSDWPYRQEITIYSSITDSDLSDFPYMLKINDLTNELFANALSSGNDIIFTDADGTTLLDHEIERYDSNNCLLEAWIRIPTLSSVTHTVIYMYYGNNSIIFPSEYPPGVWGANYVLAYHLHDDFEDSAETSNATNFGSTDDQGAIANGQLFNGVDQYLDTNWGSGAGEDLTSWTFSAWVKADSLPDSLGDEGIIHMAVNGFLSWGHHNGNHRGAVTIKTTTGGWQGASFDIDLNDINEWVYLVGTFESGSLKAYKNGTVTDENNNATGDAYTYNVVNITIGRHAYETTANHFFQGNIDEVRVSNVIRSPDWIKATYRNQSLPNIRIDRFNE